MRPVAQILGKSIVKYDIDFSGDYNGVDFTAIEEYFDNDGRLVRNIATIHVNTNEIIFWEIIKTMAEYEAGRRGEPKKVSAHLRNIAKEIEEMLSEVFSESDAEVKE